MIRPSFETALRKGEIGELIVKRTLEQDGFVVYRPATPGAHAFDLLAIKDKQFAIALDVKAKARRSKYPDTGINEVHYQVYKKFSQNHNMQFILCFVDEYEQKIYGNTLDKLDEPRTINHNGKTLYYPWVSSSFGSKDIRYWPLDNMAIISETIDVDSVEMLRCLSQRNYDYA